MTKNYKKHAYITFLTRPSYLSGVILLIDSFAKYESEYPLIVLYTHLPDKCVSAMHQQASISGNVILQPIEYLAPPSKDSSFEERFTEVWTKLRVFELLGYNKLCYIDADIILLKNMDSIFQTKLPDKDWYMILLPFLERLLMLDCLIMLISEPLPCLDDQSFKPLLILS